jgi:septum formation protein
MYRLAPQQQFVLASSSPRRRELLAACGLQPRIVVSHTDEAVLPGEAPQQLVERLAALKASAVALQHRTAWVLGGDTIVVLDGKILGKPESPAHAEAMLQSMQGRSHEVWGAFAVINIERGMTVTRSHRSRVTMVSMSAARIRAYVATGEPLDKAGSYALQGIGAGLVSAVEGSPTNVIGLNIPAVLAELEGLGVIEVAGV